MFYCTSVYSSRKSTNAARSSIFDTCDFAQSDIVLLYSSPELLVNRQCASVDLGRVCRCKKHHRATVLSTHIANRPSLRVDLFVTPGLTSKAILQYDSIHTCRKSTDAGRWLNCDLCIDTQSNIVLLHCPHVCTHLHRPIALAKASCGLMRLSGAA